MFRGNAPARIDDKGRLKVPNAFRSLLESKYGRELFLTSLTGEYVRLYPMPVWVEIEEKLGQMPSTHPARLRFLDRVNFYGQVAELDSQGRVLIPARLRETALRTKTRPQTEPRLLRIASASVATTEDVAQRGVPLRQVSGVLRA